MREIKFRVWDGVDYMSNPFTLFDLQQKKIQFTTDCKVMQFIGRTDKNGNEIYEGDILCWPKYEGTKNQSRWVVEWDYKRGSWSDWSPREDAEIIGNIYQTPELLKPLQ